MTLYMVELAVKDLSAARSWLIEVVQMRELRHDPTGPFALLESGTMRIALVQREPAATGVNLVFSVADLDATEARLRNAGLTATPPVDVPHEAYRRCTVAGPEGWKVTLFQFNSPSRD